MISHTAKLESIMSARFKGIISYPVTPFDKTPAKWIFRQCEALSTVSLDAGRTT